MVVVMGSFLMLNLTLYYYEYNSEERKMAEKNGTEKERSIPDQLFSMFFIICTVLFGQGVLFYVGYNTTLIFSRDRYEGARICEDSECGKAMDSWEEDQTLFNVMQFLHSIVIIFEVRKLFDDLIDIILKLGGNYLIKIVKKWGNNKLGYSKIAKREEDSQTKIKIEENSELETDKKEEEKSGLDKLEAIEA